MIRLVLASVVALVAGCQSAGHAVLTRVRPIVEASRPEEVAVAYESLSGGQALVNADVVMHAASTMKIAVLIEALRLGERGQLDLDTPIAVHNGFKSAVDGSTFVLDARDDEDPDLYAHVGSTLPVRELARRMIVRSSNLATNLLLERVTPGAVQSTVEDLGARNMKVVRLLEDQKAYDAGISNVTTARDLMILLRAIADGSAFRTQAAQHAAFEILAAQEFNDMIPAGLPRGTYVLHKTGDITRIRHDAAIVYPARNGPYVLVVLTHGFDDPRKAADVITRISSAVFAAHTGTVR